ncbi:hypothetical protein [Phenylobacterium sp.]|uniref:hypothetical protein n=1 Tax=Phenylobacterium sp. TaxID=1871053 RepID=UPI003784C5DA
MSANYVLTTNLLAWRHTLPSSEEAFESARSAVDRLIACLTVEEAFAILLANYVSFEKAVASANIENMVERGVSMTELHSRRREVDRHLVNVLAAGEMFSDYVFSRAKKQFGWKSSEIAALDSAYQDQRNRLVGFWATERLRNAVLHNSLPITSWTTGGKWVGVETDARLEHSVTFAFIPDLLARDRKVEPELIARLQDERADKKGQVSWVHLIREYVEGLSIILGEVRKIWAEVDDAASAILTEMADRYRASLPEGREQPTYVFIVETNEDGSWRRDVLLDSDLGGELVELRRQHRPMVNLHKRALVG